MAKILTTLLLLVLTAATVTATAAAAAAAATTSSPSPPFPSMIFFENGTADPTAEAAMHADQVRFASHYQLAIAGWGEDADSQPVQQKEEEKLANISRLIKAASPGTRTAVYAGQFEMCVIHYDQQRAAMEDPAYEGMFLHDDSGKIIKQGENFLWDFRNATAVEFHTRQVTGYFARAPHVDAVFFDEGDALACQYDCKARGTCRTMPNATAWHEGAVQAWLGAARIMADAGKRAILSSQNAFAATSPELWKERAPGGGCPLKEEAAAKAMADAGVPWIRFYEYWLVPEQFGGGSAPKTGWLPGQKSKTWLYCRNQVANAVEEGKRANMHFVAAGTSALPGWGTADRIKALEFSLAGFLIARSRPDPSAEAGSYGGGSHGGGGTSSDRSGTGSNSSSSSSSSSSDSSGSSSISSVTTAGSGPWSSGTDFFGFDHQFHMPNSENCTHTRWGDCSHNWDEVSAAYARDYGTPVDDAVEVGGVGSGRFFRQYTNVNITFDCGKSGPSGATYQWKGAGGNSKA